MNSEVSLSETSHLQSVPSCHPLQDFIKNDCVFGNQFMPEQIKAQSKSILKTQRDIVYSLSPGSGMSATMDKAKEDWIDALNDLYAQGLLEKQVLGILLNTEEILKNGGAG